MMANKGQSIGQIHAKRPYAQLLPFGHYENCDLMKENDSRFWPIFK